MSRFAVNGKVPINVWCPSRDDAGNGTTTLNDLAGTNHGTLTNFALTGSTSNWVSDTGAGGIRALDFDGTNDFVVTGLTSLSTAYTFSCWVKTTSLSGNGAAFAIRSTSVVAPIVMQVDRNNSVFRFIMRDDSGILAQATGANVAVVNQWHHLVAIRNANNLSLYVDGALYGTASASFGTITVSAQDLGAIRGGSPTRTAYWVGRLDDARLFDVSLDASDVAYLYNSGAGRGRLAPTRRRNNFFIFN